MNINDDIFDANINECGEIPEERPVKGTLLTADVYSSTMSNLKKSFQEAVEVLTALEHVQVVGKSVEEMQMEYTEAALEEAFIQSYMDGPIFEASDEERKNDIKKASKAIIKRIKKEGSGDYNIHPAVWTARLITGNKELGRKGWKNVGTFYCKSSKIKSALDDLCKKYAEELGDLTLNVDCFVDYEGFSKLDDVNIKDKKSLEEAAEAKGNLYWLYVDTERNSKIETIKIRDLNKTMAKFKK